MEFWEPKEENRGKGPPSRSALDNSELCALLGGALNACSTSLMYVPALDGGAHENQKSVMSKAELFMPSSLHAPSQSTVLIYS